MSDVRAWRSPPSRVVNAPVVRPGRPRLSARLPGTIDPRGLGLPFRAARGPRDPRRSRCPKAPGPWVLLSWPGPLHPFAVRIRCVHSRRSSHRNGRSPSGRGFHPPTSRSARVVSLHLDGFLRTGAAGLLHPAPGPGVRRVSVGPHHHRARPRPGAPWFGSSFPRRGHPSKGFPRPQPYRITAALALVPLPSPDPVRERGRVDSRALLC